MSRDVHSEKGGGSSYTMTAAVPDHDAIHPSTNFSETVLSKNGTADDNLVDPEQTPSSAPIEVDGGYGWMCVLCVFLVNAHTWGINSVRPHSWSLVSFWPTIWTQIHSQEHQTSTMPLSEASPSVWLNSSRQSQPSRLECGVQELP